jgi:hypothetical protein
MIAEIRNADPPRIAVWPPLIGGAVGLALLVLGWLVDPAQAFRSYLVGYLFWLGLPVGMLAIAFIQFLTGGVWGLVVRRLCEAGAGTLGMMAVLFLPILFGLPHIYAWARPEFGDDPGVAHLALYLSPGFFGIRAAIYLLVWVGLGLLLVRWSAGQERESQWDLFQRFRPLATVGVIALGLTVSFAAMDWVMSIDPTWASTIYGAMVACGMLFTAHAFLIVAVIALRRHPALAPLVTPAVLNDLGSLLLAFLLLWAYLGFFQYLLIWSGNLTHEIPWYLARIDGAWRPIALVLAAVGFAAPLGALVLRAVKRDQRMLGAVAALILGSRFLDVFGLVEPSYGPPSLARHWMDLAAFTAVGGFWLALFAVRVRAAPLVPLHDARLYELADGAHGSG